MRKTLRSLVLSPEDTVAVLLEKGAKGDTVTAGGQPIVLREDIEFAHKVLIKDSAKNAPVIKYGVEIGYMLAETPKGSWIHGHNMGCDRGKKRREQMK